MAITTVVLPYSCDIGCVTWLYICNTEQNWSECLMIAVVADIPTTTSSTHSLSELVSSEQIMMLNQSDVSLANGNSMISVPTDLILRTEDILSNPASTELSVQLSEALTKSITNGLLVNAELTSTSTLSLLTDSLSRSHEMSTDMFSSEISVEPQTISSSSVSVVIDSTVQLPMASASSKLVSTESSVQPQEVSTSTQTFTTHSSFELQDVPTISASVRLKQLLTQSLSKAYTTKHSYIDTPRDFNQYANISNSFVKCTSRCANDFSICYMESAVHPQSLQSVHNKHTHIGTPSNWHSDPWWQCTALINDNCTFEHKHN